jgi:hypothetical protein
MGGSLLASSGAPDRYVSWHAFGFPSLPTTRTETKGQVPYILLPTNKSNIYIYIYIYVCVCVYTYGHLYLSGMRLVRCASIRNMHPSTTHTCLKEIGLHVQSVSTIMDPIVNMIQGTYMTI